MTPRLLVRPEAQVDLEQATLWYEDQRHGLGEDLSDRVFELIERIAESPLQFPTVAAPVRRGLVHRFPDAIYFVHDEPEVVILAILHQRRDPAVWKRRV